MNPDAANLPSRVSVSSQDEARARARLIRRSIRCLIFGAIGAVPILGLGGVWLTLSWWKRIAEETGESASLRSVWSCLGAGCLFGTGFSVIGLESVSILVLLAAQVGAAILLRRAYLSRAPAKWNPARHFCYYGVGLAIWGLFAALAGIAAGVCAGIMEAFRLEGVFS